MTKEEQQKIKENVMKTIKTGKVSMKPRIHFLLKSVGVVLGSILVFGALLYIVSFIIFALRINGVLEFSSFGFSGVLVVFSSLPWLLIVISLLLIAILEILGKKFSFVYRQPLLYSIIAIVVVVGGMGILVDKTPLHAYASSFALKHKIPGGQHLYERIAKPTFKRAGVGIITEITEEGLILEGLRGEIIQVATSSETRFPKTKELSIGDYVVVIGERDAEEGLIEAIGIKPFDPEFRRPPFDKEFPRAFFDRKMK